MNVVVIEEQEQIEQQTKPEWLPMLQAQEMLGLTRYLLKKLRQKHHLRVKRTIDGRIRLIDLNEARRCMQKEVSSAQ
jgi:hypothetical protein